MVFTLDICVTSIYDVLVLCLVKTYMECEDRKTGSWEIMQIMNLRLFLDSKYLYLIELNLES